MFGSSKKPYGYKVGEKNETTKKNVSQTPGHGTSWGTNFAGGVGQWKPKKQGVSKKMLGLGVGAGFLGGAALGVAGTMASYSVYHKYQVDTLLDLLIFSSEHIRGAFHCLYQNQLHDW